MASIADDTRDFKLTLKRTTKYQRLAQPIELYCILYAYIISVHENSLIEAQAAGVIHTDFEKGFIRAEVMKYDELKRLGTEQAVKDAGL